MTGKTYKRKIQFSYHFIFVLKYFESHFLGRQKVFLVDLEHALVGDHDDLTVLLLVLLPQVAGHGALNKTIPITWRPESQLIITFPPLSQFLHPIHQYFSYRFPEKIKRLQSVTREF